jgi:type IV pilus assembly protein PilM
VKSLLSKSKIGSAPGGRPPAAIEISAEGVLGAAIESPGSAPVYAFAPLPPDALVPGIAEPNIRSSEQVVEAIRSALSGISLRSRYVTVVLPDSAVRVFMLDFESLPDRAAEAIPVLRLRMRKMVPFDVENAGISYQILSRSETATKVLAVILPSSVLAEYEDAVRAAGYEPGAVLPFSLATLEVVDSMEAVLTANLSPLALTTSITNGSDLLLHRTLELPEDPAQRLAEIQRGIAVAAAYYEDTLRAPAREIHYAGYYSSRDFAQWIAQMDLNVVDLVPKPDTGAATSLRHASVAGAAGALAGAR